MATVTVMTADATNAALDTKVDKTTSVLTGTGLTGGGDLSAGRTLTVDGTVMRTINNLNDVSDKAAARANLNLAQRTVFDVRDYLAIGDGVADDTTPILNALSAANAAGGGCVYLPVGTYKTSASIVIPGDNIVLKGESEGSTTIKPVSGALFDAISTPVPASTGLAGYIHNFVGVSDLSIDGSAMAGTTAGQGNGIHFYGVRYSYIERVSIHGVPNYGIILDGDITNFSYSITVHNNKIINGGAGLLVTFSEEAFITNNDILQANATMAAAQPIFTPQDNTGYLVRLVSGYCDFSQNVVGSSGTHTSAALQVENSGPTRIANNRFDSCRYQAIRTTGPNNIIEGNQIGNPSQVGSVEGIKLGSSNNIVLGNQFDLTNGAAHYTYCISEPVAETNNIIQGNRVQPGTAGTIQINSGSSGDLVTGNVGYNPVGHITSPTVPASTVAYTNNFGMAATVYINGGTVSNISIDGVAIGTGNGFFRINPGKSIAITYTAVPTWFWFLD